MKALARPLAMCITIVGPTSVRSRISSTRNATKRAFIKQQRLQQERRRQVLLEQQEQEQDLEPRTI
jgi:hypothetical protein